MIGRFNQCVRFHSRRAVAIALALAFGLSLCGRASDERAVKTRVAPVYPEIAKRMRISGVVKLEVIVDSDGKVTDVKPVSGNHMLSEAAETAVRKWRYVAASSQSTVDVDLNFELTQ